MTLPKLSLRSVLLPGLLGLAATASHAQSRVNAITTAVPILTISPDGRSSALGEAGVAISPDANAGYYNPGKLGFVRYQHSAAVSYTPWLAGISNDMGLAYLSGTSKIGERSTLSANLMYFDLGRIEYRTAQNQANGEFNPKEYALTIGYGQKLSDNLGVGINARYIRSNLTGGTADTKPGNAVAVDLGAYYNTDLTIGPGEYSLAFGAAVSNIGNKITYTDANQPDFLPTNLKLGTAITKELDAYNKITLTFDANKLLVPSPYYDKNDPTDNRQAPAVVAENEKRANYGIVRGITSSFSDAPGGFSEELKEINLSAGAEYVYNDLLMARVGYFYENPMKGDRQYLSFGAGVRYQVFGIDGTYLVPNSKANPLAQTLRVSLHFNFNELSEAFGSSDSPTN
ncbi:type IX secretion system outer membrane channel protein PorV [Hymenobacter endophyticus]|uniref:Type IX secretion system outer membrane channel protein PorV n=1 Tax=Hymenobacter endophyticus TaxID=3076335 RepID=A0ABU3TMM0_9BACT|nr:type IX secretion system outer membrane channel protein PorV [Hymenobacter endophyticus]MDU0372628.1 type IX secretion system outer membrane channel protein PorV [Hymenobacter endophyticus]